MNIFFIIFFINYLSAFGKEIVEYKGRSINISSKILVLEDKNKKFKDEDVIKGLHDDKFQPYNRKVLYLWNSDSFYYLKINLNNLSSSKKLSFYGWFGPVTLNRTKITSFYLKDNKVVESKFTRKINIEDKEELLNYGHASLEILPNEIKSVYIKVSSTLTTPLILTEIEKIIKEEKVYFAITNIFNGLSFLIILVIIGFYLKLKKDYLLYYILVFVFTCLKSNLVLRFLRNYIDFDIYKTYSVAVFFYIYFLVNFIISILKLDKKYINIKNYLNLIKYITMVLSTLYFFNVVSYVYFVQTRGYIYLTTYSLILFAALKRYKDNWIYKAFLFGFAPNWLLYTYTIFIDEFKLKIITFDIRIYEFMEIFANLFLIAGILVYDAKELWKGKNTVEDQEEFIKIINGADNLMHGLLTLIHSYKKEIKFDRVMFFRRKVDRENEEVLHYDFSVPLSLNERDEEKKYFDLAKYLRKDSFDTYYICEDIQSNELYKTLLPKYKSLIELRLKFVEGGDLGYIVILSNNKIEYEYNEVMKDFRYKASLLVQHFKTIDDIRDKYGSIIVEETLRNFHMEVLRDAEKDVSGTLEQLVKIRTISDKYVVSNDPNVKRVLNLFYDDLEKLMINIKKDLTFDNPDKKTKSKIRFNYNIIEEMLNYLKDIARKTTNKVNINVISQVDSDYELYGHIKIIRSIINHYLTYMYSKIIMSNIEANITISTTLEEGRLKIDTRVEGVNISLEELKKEYNNEVHKVLLNSTRSKLELKSEEDIVHIVYLLNLLTKEEKKRFDVKHLDYDDNEDI